MSRLLSGVIRHRLLLTTTMSLLALNASAAEDSSASAIGGMQADALVYRTDKGVTFQVTAEGLSLIQVGGRDLAGGGWTAFNAEPWFKDSGSGRVDTKPWREKSIAVVGQRQARVRHVKGDITCLTDYTFAGEDLLISARVENEHAEEPLNVVGFSGLEFKFDRPPTGLMMVQHISYFQAHGVGLCHPGHWSRIGGSYAVDGSIGVGLSPWKTGWNRTLLLWDTRPCCCGVSRTWSRKAARSSTWIASATTWST